MHGSIPTRDVLHHRRVCTSNLCPRCLTGSETIEHCLFHCVEAVCVWKTYGLDSTLSFLQGGDPFSWSRRVYSSHGSIIFIIMWVVWCARNDFLFNNHRSNMHESVAKIHSLLSCRTSAFDTQLLDSIPSIHPRQVSWSRPAEGTICLNVDGSLLGSPQTAGFGGLIRNNVGAFLEGFYGTASQSNILYVEIMAVLHGLELCWNKGFRDVVCFSDSLLTVKLIKEGVSNCHSLANEVHIIRQLLGRVWRVVIDHTLREDNKCADLLAKLGASANSPLVLLTVPPTELLNLIDPDVRGVIFIRE
ncbi:unnamed protein product [Trifolium pratense]|uniref:Uncharacterized protein n=1 Tax=Trifolium pratense TaxID=57577 RepID=A0ACB0IMV3_TRIPR|nr:unnamed protein product [Trifolium pratense]